MLRVRLISIFLSLFLLAGATAALAQGQKSLLMIQSVSASTVPASTNPIIGYRIVDQSADAVVLEVSYDLWTTSGRGFVGGGWLSDQGRMYGINPPTPLPPFAKGSFQMQILRPPGGPAGADEVALWLYDGRGWTVERRLPYPPQN